MEWLADISPHLGTGLTWIGAVLLVLWVLPIAVLAGLKPAHIPSRFVALNIDRLSGGFLSTAMICAIIMVVAQIAVVIARHAFGLAFTWLNEIVLYAFAAMFLLASAGALRDDAHVRVDILRPRFGAKGRAGIELAGAYLFILPICLLIFWAGALSLSLSWARLEPSRESDGLPLLFLFKTLIPVFAGLLAAQGLSEAIKAAFVIKGDTSLIVEHEREPI